MSTHRRIKFAVGVTWLSRFVSIALGLVLIPVLFRNLGDEELGVWFILGQSSAFLILMDMGLAPTLTRRIAFAKGLSGKDVSTRLNDQSKASIADLIATGRRIYWVLVVAGFGIAWVLGFAFLYQINLEMLEFSTVLLAWTVMCTGYAITVWASVWTSLLQGVGQVGWDGLFTMMVNILVQIAQIVVVLLGAGLLTLAVVAAIGAVAARTAVLVFIKRRHSDLLATRGSPSLALFRSLLKPALKYWVTGVGAFLILKTDQYFIATFEGTASVPDYQAAYQVVMNLMLLSISFAMASHVFVSQLWEAGARDEMRAIVLRNLRHGLTVMGVGVVTVLISGQDLFELWLGPGHFIGYPVLIVMATMLFLETQHSAIAAASRATEDEPFMFWALGAGFLNMFLTYFFIHSLGVLGVALGTFLAQLMTNNWYVVWRGLSRLEISIFSYVRSVILPVAVAVSLAIIFGLGGTTILEIENSFLVVLWSALVGSFTILASFLIRANG